jgi:hypothetical protein
MDMSLYTLMSFIQIHVYYFIFHNALFVNNLLISNENVIYLITTNYLIELNNKLLI